MIKRTLLVSSALMLSVVGFCQSSAKLVLDKGQKFLIENKFNVTSKQEMMGQAMDSKSDFSTLNVVEVKDIKGDNYNLTSTYTKVKASMNAMGQDMNFDSDKKEDMEGEMGSGLKDFIGHPNTVVVNKMGKIVTDESDTSGIDSQGMISMMMKQLLGGDPKQTGYGLSESFMIIPSKAKPGFTWADSTSLEGQKRSANYTIKEIRATDAVVTVSGTLDVDTKTEMQGMQIVNKSTGKINGEDVVDLKTGLIKQKNSTIDIVGKLEAAGQQIPTTSKIIVVTTLSKL